MRRLTRDEVFALAAAGVVVVFAQLGSIPCNDIWWHLATGRIIASTHAIPTVEPFSYTEAGAGYFNQPWIAQLVLYATYRIGGAALLLFEHGVTVGVTYALVLRLAWRRSKEPRFAAWGLLLTAVALGIDNWGVRPQTLAMPFVVTTVAWTSDAFRFLRAGPPPADALRIRWLPVMMLVWVNLHGSFVLGLFIPGAAFFGELLARVVTKRSDLPLRRLLAILGLTFVASFVNPRGAMIYPYVLNIMTAPAMVALNPESAPPTPFYPTGLLFFVVSLVLVVLVALVARAPTRRPTWGELAVVAYALVQAIMVRRAIVYFGFVVTPLLVVLVSDRIRARQAPEKAPGRSSESGSAMPLALVGLLIVLTSPWIKPHLPIGTNARRLLEDVTPVAAVEHLNAEQPRPARLFNDLQYGSYMQFAAPEQKVFIDTRMDFYPYDLFREYLRLSAAQDVDALVDKWSIDAMLLDKASQSPLAKRMREDPRWTVRFEDEHSLFVVKR